MNELPHTGVNVARRPAPTLRISFLFVLHTLESIPRRKGFISWLLLNTRLSLSLNSLLFPPVVSKISM